MWRSSLISRNVLLASILLSKALPIFLMATSSFVSAFLAALKEMKKIKFFLHIDDRRESQLDEKRISYPNIKYTQIVPQKRKGA